MTSPLTRYCPPPRLATCPGCGGTVTASRPLGCPLRIDHHLAPAPEYADLSGSTCRGAGKLVADPEARAKRERERVFNRRREAERRERMRGA